MYADHRLSLAYLTVQGCPPLDHVRAAAAAGYDSAGLRLIAPLGLDLAHPIVGDKALIGRLKSLSSELGVDFLDGEVFTLTPATDVREWQAVLETAAELSMPLMQITSEDPDRNRAADNLARIAGMAADHGIAMAIEFMRWRTAATIEDAAELAGLSGARNVGILLDALHLSRSGGSPAAVAALPSDLILYLQLCDAGAEMPADDPSCIAEARGGRLQPGTGALWLRELMDVLPADIAISVETPNSADHALDFTQKAQKGMDFSRRFLASLGR